MSNTGTIIAGSVIAASALAAGFILSKKPPTVPPVCPSPCGSFDTYVLNSDGTKMGATLVTNPPTLIDTGVKTTFLNSTACTNETVNIYSQSGTLSTEWYVKPSSGGVYGISTELCTATTTPPPCPNSCSVDSDCSGCGADFVCENGQCVKQIPVLITAPLSANIESKTVYTVTGCIPVDVILKCSTDGDYLDPDFSNAAWTVDVVDSSGRSIPGVPVSISPSTVDASLSFTYQVSTVINGARHNATYTSGQTATVMTGTTGIQISVYGDTLPVGWQDVQSANYPAAVTKGVQEAGPFSFGEIDYKVLGTVISGITLIRDTVYFESIPKEIGGCPCL